MHVVQRLLGVLRGLGPLGLGGPQAYARFFQIPEQLGCLVQERNVGDGEWGIGVALGASFGGAVGVTTTSGPGHSPRPCADGWCP